MLAFAMLWCTSAISATRPATLQAEAEELAQYLDAFVLEPEGGPATEPMRGAYLYTGSATDGSSRWVHIDEIDTLPARVVVLVHGLDEPGTVWENLSPELKQAGHIVLRFEYPNDQRIADSAEAMHRAMRAMRVRGVDHVDIVGHSMGGLVSRDLLTRDGWYGGVVSGHDDLPDVGRLITLGTPHRGSPWARLRILGEMREIAQRILQFGGEFADASWVEDGMGQAGEDLLPGSAFLQELNARPSPEGLEITNVVGIVGPDPAQSKVLRRSRLLARAFNQDEIEEFIDAVEKLSGALGDGVVPVESAVLDGVDDVVHVDANHRGMIRYVPLERRLREALDRNADGPPAIPIVLDRLSSDPQPGAAEDAE